MEQKSGGGRVLVAEDDRFYRQILAKRLEAAGHEVVLTSHGEEAWDEARMNPPEVLLSDWMMPRMDGYELCRLVKTLPDLAHVYCILLTAKDRVEDKVAALDSGVDDYLLKPCDDSELLARVRTGLRIHRLHTRLEEVSITDALTGLRNRRYFDERLDDEVSRARRYHSALGLVMVDLDRFKAINDDHGHPVGDAVLNAVGRMLQERVRAGEIAARYGGDEFVVLMPNTPLEGARAFAEAVENALESLGLLVAESAAVQVAGSAGYAELAEEWSGRDLVEAADRALYERKQQRRAAAARTTAERRA